MTQAAEKAGAVAKRFWGKSPKSWEKDQNAGPVSEADLAVNDLLYDTLRQARPDYGWLSEETTDTTDRLNRDRVFIVDPIDGTRSFLAGEKTWAHSLAIAEQGKIVAAVIFLPLLEKMYAASRGAGATLNDRKIHQSGRTTLDQATVLAARPTLNPTYWHGPLPGFERHFRPSLAYRMALVAEGRFDAMITFRPTWEWDVAAGVLISQEAGAKVSDQFGVAPLFNNRHPQLPGLIAAPTQIHDGIYKRLAKFPG